MELDWYSEEEFCDATIFNENSVISYKNDDVKNNIENAVEIKNYIKIENCFEQNFNVSNGTELLNILNYLSAVSNNLRTLIRSKNKQNKGEIYDFQNENVQIINQTEYDKILKYLNWIKEASIHIKSFFAVPFRKDNSFDPLNIKPFKTSSYKFCNFKESCSIHKNKNKTCDKNHFVFDMIINDINKLIESINLVDIGNLNWILSNRNILIHYSSEEQNYSITKLNNIQANIVENNNYFLIDKALIFKSFDVLSYVLNKMYEEAYSFLNYNTPSHQILI